MIHLFLTRPRLYASEACIVSLQIQKYDSSIFDTAPFICLRSVHRRATARAGRAGGDPQSLLSYYYCLYCVCFIVVGDYHYHCYYHYYYHHLGSPVRDETSFRHGCYRTQVLSCQIICDKTLASNGYIWHDA